MSFPFYAISLDDFETRPKIQRLINFVAMLRNFLGFRIGSSFARS